MFLQNFIKQNILVLLLLTYASIFLFSNYAIFPYFEGDEGIYISRARSFIEQGKITPGTYWYDHAPFGWIFISPFVKLLFSLSLFDSYLTAGRFFIVILNLFNIYFLFKISTYLFKDKQYLTTPLSIITSLLYLISPLYIYFGKRVLLDNIMIFWVLFSLYILISKKERVVNIVVSSLLFSLAVLTKENAILFILPYILFLIIKYKNTSKTKTFIYFFVPFLAVLMLYPLYAYVRGELFLNNYFNSGGKPSLISTIIFQANRDKSFVFDFNNNPFWKYSKFWLNEDTITMGIGIVSSVLLLILGIVYKNKKTLAISLLIIPQLLFLMRGGVVYEFYILPMLPFLSLNIVYLIYMFLNSRPNSFTLFLPLLMVSFYNCSLIKGYNPFLDNQTIAQINTIKWIKQNYNNNNLIVSDSFLKADFYDTNLKSHLDIEYNSNVKNSINNGKENIDLIVFTKQVEWDLDNDSFIKKTIKNFEETKNYKSNGWDVKLYKPKTTL